MRVSLQGREEIDFLALNAEKFLWTFSFHAILVLLNLKISVLILQRESAISHIYIHTYKVADELKSVKNSTSHQACFTLILWFNNLTISEPLALKKNY